MREMKSLTGIAISLSRITISAEYSGVYSGDNYHCDLPVADYENRNWNSINRVRKIIYLTTNNA